MAASDSTGGTPSLSAGFLGKSADIVQLRHRFALNGENLTADSILRASKRLDAKARHERHWQGTSSSIALASPVGGSAFASSQGPRYVTQSEFRTLEVSIQPRNIKERADLSKLKGVAYRAASDGRRVTRDRWKNA